MKQVLKYPVFAQATDKTVTVYQAYNPLIGEAADRQGTLDVPGFSKTRMTWIKPSYLWMMYRCGWGRKDANQKTILQIELDLSCFAALLEASCLSSFDAEIYPDQVAWKADLTTRPNRVQWDPDKDLRLAPLERRAIQIGIAGPYVDRYIAGILAIKDITSEAQEIEAMVKAGDLRGAKACLPNENPLAL